MYIYIHLISFVTLENPEFSIEQNFITQSQLNKISSHIDTTFFILYSSVDEYLASFHILTIVNRATMNIGIIVSR